MTRMRDIIFASAGLLLCAPLFIIVALIIPLESRGPAFFRQERVGQGGCLFRIHKFRTMSSSKSGLAISTSTDPRITRVGKILRASKIDELPQLVDVLLGKMSLVGPRPEVPDYVAQWPPELRPIILSVRPGITDPATILLRRESEVLAQSTNPERTYVDELLPLKASAYADYVLTRSFVGDLRILFATFGVLVRRGTTGEWCAVKEGLRA